MNKKQYDYARKLLLRDRCKALLQLEKDTADLLAKSMLKVASKIKVDFDKASELKPFWEQYAPVQRGYKPRGEAFPWGEVGEKVVEGYLYSLALTIFKNVRFIGLPYGHDIRFVTDSAFIHVDAKSTGPTDNAEEIVSSPNQVTGNGKLDATGKVYNEIAEMKGTQVTRAFQPELAPFYIIDRRIIPTLTYYLKIVYSVQSPGNQPLEYLELICIPNGLALFDGPSFSKHVKGLLVPGKDEIKVTRKRTRIKLDPLVRLGEWRRQKIKFNHGKPYIELGAK